jgi:RNA polymerase sigma-70 factor (ECF subfamily)
MRVHEDADVIGRVLAGETEQFAHLVGRYQVPLYRYAVAMTGDHDVADDMVQDALVRAYTSLASCRDRARFRFWLFRMLRNRCFDHLRDPRRRSVPLAEAFPIVDGAEDPGGRVERAQLRADLRDALDRLPDAQREAFLLHHVEEMPYEAMAELVGASVSALKMRVQRARGALAAALQERDVTNTPLTRLSSRRG